MYQPFFDRLGCTLTNMGRQVARTALTIELGGK
jgi:hypothetical protein